MKRYLWIGALLLSFVGIVLTGYLTQAHFTGAIGNICTKGQGCGIVLQSSWSQFGGLPTAFYGFAYYLISLVLFLTFPVVDRDQKTLLLNVLLGLHLSAFAISFSLISYAVFGLGSGCLYCYTSLGLVTLLTGGTVFWKVRREEPEGVESVSSGTWQIASVGLLIAALVLGGLAYSSSSPATQAESERAKKELKTLINEGRTIGNPDAPIRVVEFFDLACPHCQRFALNTFPKIRQNYINTGKVVWTFRSFPITRAHPNSLYAHGALSLVPSNKYLEAKKTIMRNAKKWNGRNTDNPKRYFGLFLSEYGLNEGPSKGLLRSIRFRTRDFAKIGIRQTPSFLVNGKVYKGGLPYRRWQSIFDSILQKQN